MKGKVQLPDSILKAKAKTAKEAALIAQYGIVAVTSEDDIQTDIVDFLRTVRKCEVLETFKGQFGHLARLAREKGLRVGLKATKGVPDLLVSEIGLPVGCWLGMELKKEKGELSPEQQVLETNGRIVVCRSIEEADRAWQAFKQSVQGAMN